MPGTAAVQVFWTYWNPDPLTKLQTEVNVMPGKFRGEVESCSIHSDGFVAAGL